VFSLLAGHSPGAERAQGKTADLKLTVVDVQAAEQRRTRGNRRDRRDDSAQAKKEDLKDDLKGWAFGRL